MFCALLRPRYQVSVYRTIGPLVVHALALYRLLTKSNVNLFMEQPPYS